MAALCCISNLNLLKENSDQHQGQLKVAGESTQPGCYESTPAGSSTLPRHQLACPTGMGERSRRVKLRKLKRLR